MLDDGYARRKERGVRGTLQVFHVVNVGAIKAESRNGDVTLSGTVNSRAERALAERVARGINGVSSVNNRLTVSM